MKLDKALRREKKRKNSRKMVVDGKGIFNITDKIKKREQEIRRRREEKEKILNAEI